IETVETAKGEIQTEDWPEVVLKITLRYDNQSPNIIMCFPGGVLVFDVDDTQIWRQSNFGWDEGGIIGVHAFISSPESDEVKVVFQYPQFWLMDEYALSFSL
ncbi:MAG: hypothetical protein LBB49_00980, partial [Gracilibacteraceae bacterium]|nr:hypothetical protein [Gracilibacteraceae bacterium]